MVSQVLHKILHISTYSKYNATGFIGKETEAEPEKAPAQIYQMHTWSRRDWSSPNFGRLGNVKAGQAFLSVPTEEWLIIVRPCALNHCKFTS